MTHNNTSKQKVNLSHASIAARELATHHGITDQQEISGIASRLKTAAHHGGMNSRLSRFVKGKKKGGAPDEKSLIATLSKAANLPYDPEAKAAGHPKIKKTQGWLNVPASLDEGCDCDANKKVMKKIKEKYMKEYTSPWMGKNKNTETVILNDFTELNLHEHFGKKVMVETDTGVYHGVLAPMRENCAIMEGDEPKKVFDPASVNKLIVDGQRIVISEGANKPNDTDAWSDCKSQAKKKFDVYPSAYANAWASKCYKKKGGTWRKVNESVISLEEKILHRGDEWVVTDSSGEKTLGTHESREKAVKQLQAIEANKARRISEDASVLLKEKIKSVFFGEEVVNPETTSDDKCGKNCECNKCKLSRRVKQKHLKENIHDEFFMAEEIVHKDHEFTMTDDEIYQRDKLANKLLENPGKLKTKNGDTKEEAAHRLATSIIVCRTRATKGTQYDKTGKLFHDMDDNEKTSRKKRRQGRDLYKGGKEEGERRRKETITDKRGRKVTRNVIKPGQKGVIKPEFKDAAEKLRKQKKGIPAEYFRNTANIKGGSGTTRAQFAKLRRANEERRAKRKNT